MEEKELNIKFLLFFNVCESVFLQTALVDLQTAFTFRQISNTKGYFL